MPTEVIMPKVDMDMTHGTFATWHVAEGDAVRQGAPLFDIETEKAAMEVEAPASGRLRHLQARPGDRIAVGHVIAWLYAEGEDDSRRPDSEPLQSAAPHTALPTPAPEPTGTAANQAAVEIVGLAPPPTATAPNGTDKQRATPAARAAARAARLELRHVPGSGPRGRIQRADVAEALRGRTDEPRAAAPEHRWSPESGPLSVTNRAGTGVPFLLLHGFAADSLSWAPLEKVLPPARALARIDLPGHGRSPKRRVTDFAQLARMLVEAFDGLAAETGPVHIIAHSLGAALAIAISDIRPRRIASLTLIAPAGLGPEIDADAIGGIVRASRAESLAPWLRRMTATPEGISDDYARAAFRLRADPALRACQGDMAAALFSDGVQTFDLRPALARLELPTQIVWGRQDGTLPMRQALAARGEFALHLIDGAGHIPQIESPERIARIAMRLAAAVEAPL